ncbi:MAG TPA: aspartate aminotransferase, partial [Sulfobacillus sp.]|nr:aspartate aminotransferase [Sulfobacillus sp.]
ALAWLELANVAVVPGSGFGMPDYFRMSYATSMERIETGLDRMQNLLETAQ